MLALVAGLTIREILSPFTGHPFDFELWLRIGYYVSRGNDPYSITAPIPNLSFPGAQYMTWIGYPPTWAFFQAGLYKIYLLSGIDNRFVYYYIVKQPMIIADLLTGYLLMGLISGLKNVESGVRAFLFWMLCPFTIIISSVWGMFDQIILVLVLGSILVLNETKKSALMEALGFLLKVIPLIYFPILALVQTSKTRIATFLFVSVGSSIFFALLPYLFFPKWNLSQLQGVGVNVVNKIGNSMNYWVVLFVYNAYRNISPAVLRVLDSLAYLWIPAVLIATAFCARRIRGRENLTRNVTLSVLFVTLVFFLTKSIVNEQYTIYFLGFGLVDYYVMESKRRRRLFHAVWISSLAFLIANNTYFTRFLEPISTYYEALDTMFVNGKFGELRYGIMVASGIIFTVLSVAYVISLYHEINKMKDLPLVPLNNH